MKKLYIAFILIFLFTNSSFSKEKTEDLTVLKAKELKKQEDGVIKAIGDVEIKKGDRIFNAKEVEYNQKTKVIKAKSEVKVYDEKEDNIFFSETAEMLDNFESGDFYNGTIIFKNGSNISGSHIKKVSEDLIKINESNFAICPTDIFDKDLTYAKMMEKLEDEKTPLFSLKSSKVNANTEKKEIALWGTTVWLWKMPIFYIPYFKTGLAFEEKTTGFELPGIEKNNHYGYGAYVPYNIIMKRQQITITPKIYQEGNYLANIEYTGVSKDTNKWNINFNSDFVNDSGASKDLTNASGITEYEEGKYKDFRGFASLIGYYNFNDLWSFDFNSAIISDKYYIRDYYQDNLSYVESNFKLTHINMEETENFNYFQFSNLFYQELLENNGLYDAPNYVPIIDLNLQNTISKSDINNFFYQVNINATSILRDSSGTYNRITVTPTLNNRLNTKFGLLNSSIEFRGDLYYLNDLQTRTEEYNGTESKFLPQLNIEWRKSFATSSFSFQPIIKYSGSPDFETFETKIPNEDTKTQIIKFENIFSNNRFAGYDRQEFGNRITYGFESVLFNNISFGLAQGYRDNIEEDEEVLIGFEDTISDIVGYTSLIITNNFDINYRFLINNDTFSFDLNELTLNFNFNNLNLYFIYTNMEENYLFDERQQQINGGIQFRVFKKWIINLSAIADIEHNNRILESELGLIYDGGCTTWELTYTNDNPLSETERSTSVDFTFSIKFI